MIVPHEQIRASVRALYDAGGLPRGSKTGWRALDKLYTVGMHQFTTVTGTPNSGKSELVDALMVNLAKQGDSRFLIYSPENQPLALHHSKIIEKYVGAPFDPGPTQRMEADEVESAEDWMEGKFYFCKPDNPTMESIVVEAINSIASFGHRWKTGVIIDPWNYLEHHRPHGMSETEYVSDCLSRVLTLVREHYVHLWLIAHPSKQAPRRDGTYGVPTPRDISGSAHFWNKSDNCLTVWRDQVAGCDEVEVHVQKIRFKHIGRQGIAKLDYSRITGRYSDQPEARAVGNFYEAQDF